MSSYAQYLKDKKVVIVGPAYTMVGSQQGKLIDSYDTVARINDALPIPTELMEDIGRRCDILYSNLDEKLKKGEERSITKYHEIIKLRWVCTPWPFHRAREEKFKCSMPNVPFRVINVDTFKRLKSDVNGGLPQTGLCSIVDLLDYDIKELYVAGFTFMTADNQGPLYYEQYESEDITEEYFRETVDKRGTHKIDPQLRYFKRLKETDVRIRIDSVLKEILETRI
jgi:hypothetical protein